MLVNTSLNPVSEPFSFRRVTRVGRGPFFLHYSLGTRRL